MIKRNEIPIDDIFGEFKNNDEYQKSERLIKPLFDLVLEIIHRRNQLGITQKELAKKANTHQSRISKIESAEHDIRLSTLIQIAEALESQVSIKLIPYNEPIDVSKGDYYLLFRSAITASQETASSYQPIETGTSSFKVN